MKNSVGYKFVQGKKRIILKLLFLVMISLFFITTIVSIPDITTNAISNYPSPHSGIKAKACYYGHSLSNNHWNSDDGGHYDEDDNDVYDEEDREDGYERETA
ncbi:MAG: hypothetical protein HUU08_11435 [Candidatus Brocadia sp.]|nr:hypothetical protein [Candidatus Brocadia sp.]